MKMKNIFVSWLVVVCLALLTGCTDKGNVHLPVDADQTAPMQPYDLKVENLPGGALIVYQIPEDSRLLYVEASYDMSNGKSTQVRASFYDDSLKIMGFSDTLEHEVKVFSVSHSGVKSAPLTVKVKPKEAPIWAVYRSLHILNSFGGFNVEAKNETKANIVIEVLKKNDLGEFERDLDRSIYTAQDSIVSKIRGMDTIQNVFAFLVMDQWGNCTDTLYKDISPLFDTQLDPSKFRDFTLPGDALENPNTSGILGLWDGNFDWPNVSFTWADVNQPASVKGQPHMITFDLGVLAQISRFWIRPYPESGDRYYFFTTMKKFEIYGSAKPNLDGSLDDSWYLLGSYEVIKPSGLPYGTHNQEDIQTAIAGFNWESSLDVPKVRYIRIRCLENFGGGNQQSISDLKVYGDPR